MADFCEQCPMRPSDGSSIEYIGTAYVQAETRLYMGYGPVSETYFGKVGLLFDKIGNPSWPICIPDGFENEDVENYINVKTESCNGPEWVREKTGNLFFNKWREEAKCPALGSLAVSGNVARYLFQEYDRLISEDLMSLEMHKTISKHHKQNPQKPEST